MRIHESVKGGEARVIEVLNLHPVKITNGF